MKCIIISGGNPPGRELLFSEINEESFIICADKGCNCTYKYDIEPNLIMGDFDSVDKSILEYYRNKNINIECFSKDKDFTDTELVLNKAIDLKYDDICLFGCTGSRLDHFLGNVGLLYKCLKHGVKAKIMDDNNIITMHDKSFEVSGESGEYFSIIPYSSVINNLSIIGGKYPLNNYNLELGESYAVSNQFTLRNVNIIFDKGTLLLIRSKD